MLLAVCTSGALCPDALCAQSDVIKGRITSAGERPVEGARVTVTAVANDLTRMARTGADGRYTLLFPSTGSDYLVTVAALGYLPRRFALKRVGNEPVLVADAQLLPYAPQLETVSTLAERQRVHFDDTRGGVGGNGAPVSEENLPFSSLGDIAAMAASLPGVLFMAGVEGGADGFSVFGLGADQSNVTLNGATFAGSRLPRDAAVAASLNTSPYDVSKGGFSGGQLALRTRHGSNLVVRGTSVVTDARQLQWVDRETRMLVPRYDAISVGGVALGPVLPDRLYYDASIEFTRRTSASRTLLDADDAGLMTAGIAADSVNRLRAITQTLGIPADRFASRLQTADHASFLGGIDFIPPGSASSQSLGLTTYGEWLSTRPLSSAVTEAPSVGSTGHTVRGLFQLRHAGYFGALLSETTLSGAASAIRSSPRLALPLGLVRVSSTLADSSTSVQMLRVGGSGDARSYNAEGSVQLSNDVSWFSLNEKHRLKLSSEVLWRHHAEHRTPNGLGTWAFNGLEDFSAGRPVLFTRRLAADSGRLNDVSWGVALGDVFKASNALQIQYGIRVDGDQFLRHPAANMDLRRTLAARNDVMPSGIQVSPRLGFTWRRDEVPIGTGGRRPGAWRSSILEGGIGIFQSGISVGALMPAYEHTGLQSTQQLACFGNGVPIPEWSAYASDGASIPDRCADGGLGELANAAPDVTLLSNSWQPPRSLHANLRWTGTPKRENLRFSVGLTYAKTSRLSGPVDINFDPTIRFALGDEAKRPVYVSPSDIVPTSGTTVYSASRRWSTWSMVNELQSNLASETHQLSLTFAVTKPIHGFRGNLDYLWSHTRSQTRGFAGATAGNPLDVEWSRSPFDARHQVLYGFSYDGWSLARLALFGQLRSEVPFTPLVGSDINGDGLANDRAFIFYPGSTDSAVGSAMGKLLASAPKRVRRCLAAQLGQIARNSSCHGQWTSNAALVMALRPDVLRLSPRSSVALQLSNPLAAMDLLLHGANSAHGWGQADQPDRTLLYVRGFDASSGRYLYQVNEHFGQRDAKRTSYHTPAVLTLQVRIDVGPTRERQWLTSQLDRGRHKHGPRLTQAELKLLTAGSIANPATAILRLQSELGLSGGQADSVATLAGKFAARLDAIWTPVAAQLSSLPTGYSHSDAFMVYRRAREATFDALAALSSSLSGVLTAKQRGQLPPYVAQLLDPQYLERSRSGTFTYGPNASSGPISTGSGAGTGTMSKSKSP